MITDTDRVLYDVAAVQRVTGLGRSKIFEEIAAGRLASVQVGRRRMVTRAQLEAWVAQLVEGAR